MSPRTRPLAARIALALSVSIATASVLGAGYELLERLRYDAWRAAVDEQRVFDAFMIASPNPVLMWEYRPHGSASMMPASAPPSAGDLDPRQPKPVQLLLRTNRWGFRERDYASLSRPSGVERIAFIGDSVTLGLSVPEESTFARRVEVLLNSNPPPPRFETLNFGIDGYNTIQINELLRSKLLSHEPSLVVYSMCMNDFDFEDSSGEKILYFQKPRSFLLRTLRRALTRVRGTEYHHHHFEQNHNRVYAELTAMRKLLQQHGIPLLVVILPVFEDFDDNPAADLSERLSDFLAAEGIRHLNLLPAFQATGEASDTLALDAWHPNTRGHEIIAEALMPSLFEIAASSRPGLD